MYTSEYFTLMNQRKPRHLTLMLGRGDNARYEALSV